LSSPILISVVSYLNSRPFIFGLRNYLFSEQVQLQEDIPSVCADKLINGNADIGLVPVAVLPLIPNHKIISDYCIGSNGEVKSVLLLSDVPIDRIKTVLLDYQSRTSVRLTELLFREHWKLFPDFTNAEINYEENIKDNIAGVVIGDRALILRNKFKYAYDLSEEWKKMTGLPFVFACWISTRDLSEEFIVQFNAALSSGLKQIDKIVDEESDDFLSKEKIAEYLEKNIDYDFDNEKKRALRLFLELIQ
jgi:chorismate dehydratase